jgi:tetratricopeptide (TPR) repeat protein
LGFKLYRGKNMGFKRQKRGSLPAFLVLAAFLLNSFPVRAQDIVSTSEDVTSGSSVFVFRQSRKAPQARSTAKSKSVNRNTALRTESHKKIQTQVAVVQKTKPRPKATPAPNPPTTPTTTKTVNRIEASKVFAGAGETYLNQDNVDKAIDFFKKSAELDPKNNTAKLGLSEAYTRKGDQTLNSDQPETSFFYYEEAVKANPNNSGAQAGLGEAYDSIGNNEKALAAYEKAIALDPTLTELYTPLGILYYQKGEIAKAEDYLVKARAQSPDDPETQYFYGLILVKQNKDSEAITAFQTSLAKNPTAEAHLSLGEAFDRSDRDKDAIKEYEAALAINPKYAEAYYDLGVANYNREKYLDAAASYQEAIKIKNDYADAHANLAETYRQLGSDERDAARKKDYFGKALGSYSIALTLIKDDPDLYSSYGYVLGRLGRWQNAIDALNKAVTPHSDATDYSNLGWAYYNASVEDARNNMPAGVAQQKLQSAKTALEKAVSLNDKFEAAYLNLGITKNDLGEFDGAVIALQTALKLHKNWTFALNELGIAFRKLNKLDDAVEQFKKATGIDGNFAAAYYNLAESEYRLGNMKEAKKAQEKLKKLNPNLAVQLDVIFSGAVLIDVKNKVQQNNPLNKIPKPKLPF